MRIWSWRKHRSNEVTPSAKTLLKMATGIEFSKTAVTDEPVSPEARQINLAFTIAAYYRATEYSVKPSPAVDDIVARVSIRGVSKVRRLPDGDYFLWIGGPGPDESMPAKKGRS